MPQSRFTLDCTVVILLLFLTQLATGYVTVVNDYGPWDQYDGDNGAWQIDTTTTTTTTTTYLPNTRYLAKATRHKMKMKRRGMVQMGSSTSDSEMASKHAMHKKLTTKQSETTSSKKKKHTKTSESMKMIDSSSSSMKDSEKSQGKGMMGMMKGMMNGGGTSSPTMAPSPPPSASVAPTSAAPATLAPTTTAPTSAEPTQSPVSTGVPTARPSIPTSQSDFCFDVDNERCGPDSWPDLDIENNQCGGSRNSPVTLTTLDVCEPVDYVFDGGTCTFGDLEYTVNEFKISALYPSSCTPPTVLVGDLKYQVESWDFALGTGHSIDGFATFGAVEVVHKLIEGDAFAEPFTIFGMGVVVGPYDAFVDRMINGFVEEHYDSADVCIIPRDPIYEGTTDLLGLADPYVVLPDRPTFYQYLGSRTAPPCEENVFWNFASEYISIDPSQAESIRSFILDWINPETCTFDTVADPTTGSTSRPALDPGTRPISLTGSCSSA